MDKEKVTRFPIGWLQKFRNKYGKLAVPCRVSGRYLLFEETSTKFDDGDYLSIDVMTINIDGEPLKICELIITREELSEVLEKIRTEKN